MKKGITKDYRDGYILGLDSCLAEGFIIKTDKDLLIEAFDRIYEIIVHES